MKPLSQQYIDKQTALELLDEALIITSAPIADGLRIREASLKISKAKELLRVCGYEKCKCEEVS